MADIQINVDIQIAANRVFEQIDIQDKGNSRRHGGRVAAEVTIPVVPGVIEHRRRRDGYVPQLADESTSRVGSALEFGRPRQGEPRSWRHIHNRATGEDRRPVESRNAAACDVERARERQGSVDNRFRPQLELSLRQHHEWTTVQASCAAAGTLQAEIPVQTPRRIDGQRAAAHHDVSSFARQLTPH